MKKRDFFAEEKRKEGKRVSLQEKSDRFAGPYETRESEALVKTHLREIVSVVAIKRVHFWRRRWHFRFPHTTISA